MIQGVGAGKPLVMLVGDFATKDDQKTNYALSGYQENYLKDFAKNGGVDWGLVYKTLYIKDEDGFRYFDAKTEKGKAAKEKYAAEIQEHERKYLPILKNEIANLKPSIVVPLGELSFRTLTGLKGIRQFRGSVLPSNQIIPGYDILKIMPILGPYPYINEDYKLRVISRLDFTKLTKHCNDSPIPDNFTKIWIARNSDSLRNYFDRQYPACFKKPISEGGFLVFDVETYYGIPTCISFCFDGQESVTVPLLDKQISSAEKFAMYRLVARMLASKIPKVNQNIKYDWKRLEFWGFKVNNVIGDTMLAASILYCEFPKNLGFLTSIYTELPYFKNEGKEFNPFTDYKEQLYKYCAKDSLAVHQIFPQQLNDLAESGSRGVYDNLVKCMPIYKQGEQNGIQLDMECRNMLWAKYDALYRQQLSYIRKLSGDSDLNPLSPKQMQRVIFEELQFRKVRGVTGTDESSIDLLLANSESPVSPINGKEVLRTLKACRKIHKVIEILELPAYPDDRFRCEYNLAGTETGRTSAGSSLDVHFFLDEKGKLDQKFLGHSLQTIGKHGFKINGIQYGKDVRKMFVARKGYKFVEIDGSQAEARVDTVLAKNFDLLKVFDSPTGIHRLTGSWIFNRPPEEIKKNTPEYHLSKIARHSGERNITAAGMYILAQNDDMKINLTTKECGEFLKTFHTYQPEIREVFHKEVEHEVRTNTLLQAPNGRFRRFYGRIDNNTINEAISFLPQAIVTDVTKFTLIPVYEHFHSPQAYFLYEAHDGTMSEVMDELVNEYIDIYQKNAERPIDFRTGSLKRDFELSIPTEASIGETWYDLKEAVHA